MRYLPGFIGVLAFAVMACSETGDGDSDANCGVYCDKVVECYPMEQATCVQHCTDESARESAISQECASAVAAERLCVGGLSCDEVALWGYKVPPESFPCLTESSAVEARCESPCQEDDDCDDGRECSADICFEGKCHNEFSSCPCEAPLSDYCAGSDCPTWDEAVALAETCDPHWRAAAGRCGDFWYIETNWGLDRGVRYFDAAGVLVALVGCTDCNCIACGPGHDAFCIHYGAVPECELQLEQILCEEQW